MLYPNNLKTYFVKLRKRSSFYLRFFTYYACVLFLCTGCNGTSEDTIPHTVQEFNGRDEWIAYGQSVRRPVYHAKVPLTWKRLDPDEKTLLTDTTKPLVSFSIDEELILNVHSFPFEDLEMRPPPEAQVERWQKQIGQKAKTLAQRIGHSGFAGLYFEAAFEDITVCAWSFQLDFDLFQRLRFFATTVEEEEHYKQMSADYTIKVSGPTKLIEEHRLELNFFADSFELIQEIPNTL